MHGRTAITVISNSELYPNQKTNDFRYRPAEPLSFDGDHLCGLFSITYPHSWKKLGLNENPYLDIIFNKDRIKHVKNVRLIFSRGGYKTEEQLIKYINNEIERLVKMFGFHMGVHKKETKKTDGKQKTEEKQPAAPTPPKPEGKPSTRLKRSKSAGDEDTTFSAKRVRIESIRKIREADDDVQVLHETAVVRDTDDPVDLQKRFDEIAAELRTTTINLDTAQNNLKLANAEKLRAERDRDSAIAEKNQTEKLLQDTNSALHNAQLALTNAITEKEAAEKAQKDAVDSLEAAEKMKQLAVNDANLAREEMEAKGKTASEAISDLEKRVQDTEQRVITAENNKLQAIAMLENKTAALDLAETRIQNLESDIQRHQTDLDEREITLNNAITQLGQANAELAKSNELRTNLESEIANLRRTIRLYNARYPTSVEGEQKVLYETSIVDNVSPKNVVDSLHPQHLYHWTKYYNGSSYVHHDVKREAISPQDETVGTSTVTSKEPTTLPINNYLASLYDDNDMVRIQMDKRDPVTRKYLPPLFMGMNKEMLKRTAEALLKSPVGLERKDHGQVIASVHQNVDFIVFSPELAYVLGFGGEHQTISHNDMTTHSIDLNAGLHGFVIYELNGLLEKTLFGDEKASVLRYVPVEKEWGENVTLNFNPPIWIPVMARNIGELHFQLRTLSGELMPFDWGTIVMHIQFKPSLGY